VGVGGSRVGDDPPVGCLDVDVQQVIDEVVRAFRRRLAVLNSALLQDASASAELFEQVRSIIQDVLRLLKPGDALRAESISSADWDRLLSIEVGTSLAPGGIHPVESLQAGELFDVALPIIIHHCGFEGLETLNASQRLHQVIMNRIALASVPYEELLLTKLHASRREERHRISRELHDRVGHEIALALQHFDMHKYFSGTDKARAEREFKAGFTSLDEALHTVRNLSTELRRSVGEGGIKAAIESYIKDNVPGGIRASLEIVGDARLLSLPVCEELYLIMREACRNAVRHGRPSEVRLTMTVTDSEVTATVADDGQGFRAGVPGAPAGGGLPSMTERAELLNGMLKVESTMGEGTTVTVRVPLSSGGTL
jgi:signal transduction histidine kinase